MGKVRPNRFGGHPRSKCDRKRGSFFSAGNQIIHHTGGALITTSKHRLWIATSGNLRPLVRGSPLKPLANVPLKRMYFLKGAKQ